MIERLAVKVVAAVVLLAAATPTAASSQEVFSRFVELASQVQIESELGSQASLGIESALAEYPASPWAATGAIVGAVMGWGVWRISNPDPDERSCTDRFICQWVGPTIAGGAVGGLVGWSLWYNRASGRPELSFRPGS